MDMMSLRRRIMGVEKTLLPREYQQVEYLESTGTQLLTTDILASIEEDDEFYMRFAYTDVSKTQIFFGTNNKSSKYQGVAIRATSVLRLRQSDLCSPYDGLAYFNEDEWVEFSIVNATLFCKEATGTLRNIGGVSSEKFTLFGKSGEDSTLSSMKLSNAYYKRNGEYLLNLIPCYRKADQKPGMYDLVSGEFYTNSGTGEFVVGEDV